MKTILNGILIVALLLICATVAYIIIVTKVIMRPINTFIQHMQNTDIRNFYEQHHLKNMDYETKILLSAFEDMTLRLHNAGEAQKRLEEVQTKTLFSILQSEISPHFLYNTLGSIANMCERGEGEKAADACYSLTEIIRYSSNYATAEVTLQEEIDNLQSYLAIMKSRYRQRLDYDLQIDEDMNFVMLPKLTLQPVVENAIKYSLLEEEHVMIEVFGIRLGYDIIFEIKDNGCGISQETRQIIDKRLNDFLNKEDYEEITQNIQIGGMGLSGTLIRLSIFFENRFSYEIADNNDKGGTSILLKINIKDY